MVTKLYVSKEVEQLTVPQKSKLIVKMRLQREKRKHTLVATHTHTHKRGGRENYTNFEGTQENTARSKRITKKDSTEQAHL